MNLSEVKKQLGLETLPLVRATDRTTGVPQPFLIMWDNVNRVRVVIHDDVMKDIKTADNLAINTQEKAASDSGEMYKQVAIFLTDKVEVVL